MGRVFSTGKFDMIRVSQYLIDGLKGGCKSHEYSKSLKKPLTSSTGMTSETLIYHNACRGQNIFRIKIDEIKISRLDTGMAETCFLQFTIRLSSKHSSRNF